jgi:hypothetical protein
VMLEAQTERRGGGEAAVDERLEEHRQMRARQTAGLAKRTA